MHWNMLNSYFIAQQMQYLQRSCSLRRGHSAIN